jgi:hypothetical protein
MNNVNNQVDLETPAIAALSAASKTPFLTALKVTLGIGLGRLLMFTGFILVLVLAYKLMH